MRPIRKDLAYTVTQAPAHGTLRQGAAPQTAGSTLDGVDFIVAEYHSALVPDVVPRVRAALLRSFDVSVEQGQRCGPMIRARRIVRAGDPS